MIVRARVAVPISQAPIENGAVVIKENRITQVGPWTDLKVGREEEVLDLGEVALLPGLINAHCHLELTGLAGAIAPGEQFVDWIRSLLDLKGKWEHSDFLDSWCQGASQLLRHGTTTVANIESTPALLQDDRVGTPMRVFSFLEMTGVLAERHPEEILDKALETLEPLSKRDRPVGLSPHAPYSTTPRLLELCGQAARERGLPLTMHATESRCELEMYLHRQGPLYDWLKSIRDMSDCGQGSPIRHLERCGLLQAWLLAVHVNHLSPGDAQILARNDVPVAHCPRTHAFFEREPFPYRELLNAGVNVCLGTDSLASVAPSGPSGSPPELDMLAEMREFHSHFPEVDAETLLDMATRQGARALGLEGSLGALAKGAYADLISIPFSSTPTSVLEAILDHKGPVQDVIVNGEIVSPNRQYRNL